MQPEYNGQLLCTPGPLFTSVQAQSPTLGKRRDAHGALGSPSSTKQDLYKPSQLRKNVPVIDPIVDCGRVRDYLESVPAHALEEGKERQLGVPPSGDGGPQELMTRKEKSLHLDAEVSRVDVTRDEELADRDQSPVLIHEDQWDPYKVPMNVVERWIDAYGILHKLPTGAATLQSWSN
jgi:hypothetical protein